MRTTTTVLIVALTLLAATPLHSEEAPYQATTTADPQIAPADLELLLKPLRKDELIVETEAWLCLLYTSPSPRDRTRSRMPSSA